MRILILSTIFLSLTFSATATELVSQECKANVAQYSFSVMLLEKYKKIPKSKTSKKSVETGILLSNDVLKTAKSVLNNCTLNAEDRTMINNDIAEQKMTIMALETLL